jgi:hypothetical protein
MGFLEMYLCVNTAAERTGYVNFMPIGKQMHFITIPIHIIIEKDLGEAGEQSRDNRCDGAVVVLG